MVNKNNKKAFTLVELLVVISIIALLLSILMPSLQQARFQAKRVVCLNNIKSQYLPQIMYAGDNNDKFAPHTDPTPAYVRWGDSPNSKVHELMNGIYITDTKIMLCPLQKQFGGAMADPKWVHANGDYSGWDYVDSAGDSAYYILSGYMWFANYEVPGHPGNVRFKFDDAKTNENVSEPAWPKKSFECNARKAFITHMICTAPGFGLWWNQGHGGDKDYIDYRESFEDAVSSKDNPVGYSDGHTEWTPHSQIRARAYTPRGNGGSVYYY